MKRVHKLLVTLCVAPLVFWASSSVHISQGIRPRSQTSQEDTYSGQEEHGALLRSNPEVTSLCIRDGGCEEGRIEGVFYNRIPKCASRTVFHILRAVAGKRNGVTVHNVRPPNQERVFYPEDWEEVRRNVSQFRTPFFYGQHFQYFDFNNGQPHPVTTYINVARDPVDRYTSRYYYSRYGTEKNAKDTDDTEHMSLDECLERKGAAKCVPDSVGNPIQFLCGHHHFCLNVTRSSMEVAKRNIERYYLVIGLVEKLPEFFGVLEYLLPSFFEGAGQEYYQTGHQKHDLYRTAYKQTLSNASRTLLTSHLAIEYELYRFIKARFLQQLTTIERIANS